jgi:uncharacterized membrane-anchored protein
MKSCCNIARFGDAGSAIDTSQSATLGKIPAIALGLSIIKILATTLDDTAADTMSMSWLGETTATAGQGSLNGYLVGTAIS